MVAETNEHDDDNGETIIVEDSCSKGVFCERKRYQVFGCFLLLTKVIR